MFCLHSLGRSAEYFLDGIVVKPVCDRVGRFVCEGIQVSEIGLTKRSVVITSLSYAAYTGPEWVSMINDWEFADTCRFQLANWFLKEAALPVAPFTLLNGREVRNPNEYYYGLHAQLRLESSSVARERQLTDKLSALRNFIEVQSQT